MRTYDWWGSCVTLSEIDGDIDIWGNEGYGGSLPVSEEHTLHFKYLVQNPSIQGPRGYELRWCSSTAGYAGTRRAIFILEFRYVWENMTHSRPLLTKWGWRKGSNMESELYSILCRARNRLEGWSYGKCRLSPQGILYIIRISIESSFQASKFNSLSHLTVHIDRNFGGETTKVVWCW